MNQSNSLPISALAHDVECEPPIDLTRTIRAGVSTLTAGLWAKLPDGGHAYAWPPEHSTTQAPTLSKDWNSLLNNTKNGLDTDRDRLFELLRVRLLVIGQFRLRGWPVEEIEDIVQDSLAVVFTKLESITDNPHFFAQAVLDNKIGGLLRLKKRRTMISLNPTGSQSEQDTAIAQDVQLPSDSYDEMLDHLHESEIVDKIRRALSKLSPLCQAIFLAVLQFRTVADVWEIYQEREPKLSRNAFDKRLFDCRRKLRDLTTGQLS